MKASRPRRYDSKVGTSSIISSVTGTQVAIFRTRSSRRVKSSAASGLASPSAVSAAALVNVVSSKYVTFWAVVVPDSIRSATVRSSCAEGWMPGRRSSSGVMSAEVMSVLIASSPSSPRNPYRPRPPSRADLRPFASMPEPMSSRMDLMPALSTSSA